VIVVVATTEDGLAAVRARLATLGIDATRTTAPSDRRRLVLAAVDGAEAEQVAAHLRAAGESAVARPAGGIRLGAWEHHTRPITVGGRLSVAFAWSEHDRRDLPSVVELAGGGFGSGQHPSTRLVVEQLVERIAGAERVLDVGCGSGVLGLAALALGAARVVAVDVDPDAVEATRRSAALNGVGGRLEVSATPLAGIGGPFDVVLANVGRAAIVELAPQLVDRVAPGGWLAASGITTSHAGLVAGFLGGLHEVERRTDGEWASLVLAAAPSGSPGG
jgi:ribosomal protein L11 methylase PrmA